MNKVRISYIDYVRAVGIILMVLAHIPLNDGFVHYVHGFHMPLFFVVSGFVFKSWRDKAHLFKTIKRLLIPYFTFSAAGYILWVVEIKPGSVQSAMIPLKSIIWVNSERMPIAGALWFLTAMIVVNVFVFFIESFCGGKRKYVVICAIFIFGLFETKILPFRMPWSIGAACVGVGYFYLGHLMNRCWNSTIMEKIKKFPLPIYCIVMLGVGYLIMGNGLLNMRTGEYANIPITLVNSVVYICALWLFLYRITPILEIKLGNLATELKKSVSFL